jgi:hypothetical protein
LFRPFGFIDPKTLILSVPKFYLKLGRKKQKNINNWLMKPMSEGGEPY